MIAATEAYDYDTRAEALRIIRCGEVDLTHPKLSEVVMCLSSMAFAGLMEYYGGWDFENAGWTLARERHYSSKELLHCRLSLGIDALVFNNFPHGQRDDLEVQCQRNMINIPQVKREFLLPG